MMDPLQHLQAVKNSAAGRAPHNGDFRRIRALRFTDPGFDRAVWREMCGKGWLAMRVPQAVGGAGLDLRAFCDVAEALGGELAPEPLIPAAMAARLLPRQHLPDILSGERIVLPAWQEQPGSLALVGETVLHGGRVTGRKRFVPMAAGADAFLVTVSDGLALVERSAAGVSLEIRPTRDGGHDGTLTLRDAPAERIDGDATDALDAAIVAVSAYLLGLATRVFAIAQYFLQAREQFDRSAGTFAAKQRRIADLRVQLSLTRSVVHGAADAIDKQPLRGVREAAASRCKLRAADAAMVVTRTCQQLLAGAGMADINLFLDRAMVLAPLYGGTAAHRARFHVSAQEPENA